MPYRLNLLKSLDGYDSIFTNPVAYHVLNNNVYIHIYIHLTCTGWYIAVLSGIKQVNVELEPGFQAQKRDNGT